MSDVREIDAAIDAAAPLDVDVDRRRPERLESVSPALLPLLRQPELLAEPAPSPEPIRGFADERDGVEPDDGVPARGIMFAVLFSLPVWGVFLYFVL